MSIKERRVIQLLKPQHVAYIKSQLEARNPETVKKMLQRLCSLYRSGYAIISGPERDGIENTIVGLLYTKRFDEKVRRWSLNALAQLGRRSTCETVVVQTLKDFLHEPQTTAAAIAAIHKIAPNPARLLRGISYDRQMATLAALQHASPSSLDLSSLPLNVDAANSDQLKLGLIVVGLNRSPVNLFNPNYNNAQMVKVLGSHHDNIVCQYTVWAIVENKTLGIGDLGIDLKNVEGQPPNVRSWLYQLIGKSGDYKIIFDYFDAATSDASEEARAGLAAGLEHVFFDGIEAPVLEWFTSDDAPGVQSLLLTHITKHSERSPSYQAMSLEMYEREPNGSVLREKMKVDAAGTGLYTKFRKLDFDAQADLFGSPQVTNNVTFNGPVQAGAVAVGGSATNSGGNHYQQAQIELLRQHLSQIEREIHQLAGPEELKQECLKQVAEAKSNPSPSTISTVIGVAEKIGKVAGAGSALLTLGTALAKAAGIGG
jgi:hypothetical protein